MKDVNRRECLCNLKQRLISLEQWLLLTFKDFERTLIVLI